MASHFIGPAFFFISYESIYQDEFSNVQISTLEVIIPVNYSLSTKLKNKTLLPFFKNKTNTFLKLNSVYEVNLLFCIVEACYPWTGRSELTYAFEFSPIVKSTDF